jgi:hypothetical protein
MKGNGRNKWEGRGIGILIWKGIIRGESDI